MITMNNEILYKCDVVNFELGTL